MSQVGIGAPRGATQPLVRAIREGFPEGRTPELRPRKDKQVRQQKRGPSQRREERREAKRCTCRACSPRGNPPGPPQGWISRASGRCKVRLNFKRPFSLLCGVDQRAEWEAQEECGVELRGRRGKEALQQNRSWDAWK